jgi:hypothetical protein
LAPFTIEFYTVVCWYTYLPLAGGGLVLVLGGRYNLSTFLFGTNHTFPRILPQCPLIQ